MTDSLYDKYYQEYVAMDKSEVLEHLLTISCFSELTQVSKVALASALTYIQSDKQPSFSLELLEYLNEEAMASLIMMRQLYTLVGRDAHQLMWRFLRGCDELMKKNGKGSDHDL